MGCHGGADGLDSESSDDDEAQELRCFWQQLRSSLANSSASASTAEPVTHVVREPQGPLATQEHSAGRQTCMRFASVPATPLRQQQAASASPKSCKRAREHGAKLWRQFGDLHLEVLSFLHLECISQLRLAGPFFRGACSLQAGAGAGRLISPHVQLCSQNCSLLLEHVWLQRVRWLEARSLNAKAGRLLLSSLCAPARAVRGLECLDLRNSKLSEPALLAGLLRSCRNLRTLDLSGTKLRDDGARELARALQGDALTGVRTHVQLMALHLDENGLTHAVAPQLATLALQLPLVELRLARNALGDAGAEALAAVALEEDGWGRSSLRRLDLSETGLTPAGLVALLAALASNTRLASLDLGGNGALGNLSHEDLAWRLEHCLGRARCLRELHLWRCGLADEACRLVVDAQPPQLSLLNLAMNPLSLSLRSRLGAGSGAVRF